MVIRLEGPPASTVPESADKINRIFDLLGERERLRQESQRITSFISENIQLTAENPELDPDQIARQAAVNVTQADPTFDKGLAGGFQKFASGLIPAPSTTLTEPIARGLLEEPTGIRKELIKAQLESTLALTRQRTAPGAVEPEKPTAAAKQRDSDVRILNSDTATDIAKDEATGRLLRSDELVAVNESPQELDKVFSKIMDGLKKLQIKAKGDILDKKFGKDAFDQGLKDAQEQGLKEGVHPESVKQEFEKWWDQQFQKEKSQVFQKFQDRKEFQAIAETDTAFDVKQLTDEQLDAIIKSK